MAVLDLNHGTAGNQAGFAVLMGKIRTHFARRALYRQTVRELNDLNGRELADLGISRSMIRRVALEAAWGK
ncbi:DUF1127 domain-containing protein [Paracoccus shanxieyensis]|uniref:DUF1127 domain-containing protein n=1 Tax=Paracoccus shanxieyensis TaxID=2675752 RepID=A0A6L6J2B5_9RHOB|nr:DUF1127 domain-containing protein [Paracoccus shanxieyensis]MTH88172.1 DUF1127 domain-containing protein [Paracoccus shanxieyensis]